jgi:hypothetical protein
MFQFFLLLVEYRHGEIVTRSGVAHNCGALLSKSSIATSKQ